MNKPLRIAFFPDSFLEVNGVAMTSNRLVDFARRRGLPFLCVYADKQTAVRQEGNITFVGLKRSPAAFTMDEGLKYDPLFQRHVALIRAELEKFRPDAFHITGLNDVSIIGAYLSYKMDIPLVASWHTNLHEYAARRLRSKFKFLPVSATEFIEKNILRGAQLYYKMPQVILAPNQELIDMLARGTKRQVRLMIRGVDTEKYSPAKRTVNDDIIRFGFVGRLRAEKNVRLLADLERELLKAGKKNFKFLIVGEGSERAFLEANMRTAEFPGFLDGERLSEAYANMDVFVFSSDTDAYGNVIQEANAAGVPCLVTDQGGPKFIVQPGKTGFVARDLSEFVKFSIELMDNPEKLAQLKKDSRQFALSRSWDAVFESVYDAYAAAKTHLEDIKRKRTKPDRFRYKTK